MSREFRLEGDSERIELTDNIISAVAKIVDGNPGAMNVCMQLAQNYEKVDPQSFLGAMTGILDLDAQGIYGPNIWVFYKDICGECITTMIAVMRAQQLGLLSSEKVHDAIRNYDRTALDLDEIREQVGKELDQFNFSLI